MSDNVLRVDQAQEIFTEFGKKADNRFLREVAKENLTAALAKIIDDVVAESGQNKAALETLGGEAAGSIKKAIDDAFNDFATKVSDDNVVNTYKELVDYAAANGAEVVTLVGQITALAAKTALGTGEDGSEHATVKAYVEAYVQAKVAEVSSWTAEGLEGKVNKEDGKGLSTNDFTDTHKAKLDNLAFATEDEVKEIIDSIFADTEE